jgi:DNA-binding XRE family transcriptional regulator
MWADQVDRFIPRRENMIRVLLENGDYVDYDDRTKTYRYRTRGVNPDIDIKTDEEYRQRFSENMCELMHAKSINQRKLAELTGLSTVTINKYASGQATPSFPNAVRIADALDYPVDDLIR